MVACIIKGFVLVAIVVIKGCYSFSSWWNLSASFVSLLVFIYLIIALSLTKGIGNMLYDAVHEYIITFLKKVRVSLGRKKTILFK